MITPQSKDRIHGLIGFGQTEGTEVLVDGRGALITGYESGHFIRPSVIRGVKPDSDIDRTEIFGPVLGIMYVNTIDEAIHLVNFGTYGNMACLFIGSGVAARKFRSEADAGNIGCGCTNGFHPIQWLERKLLWRSVWSGTGRNRVLHAKVSCY